MIEESARAMAVDRVHAATALYTASHVVDSLLDRVGWPQPGGRLLDPSAGDGSFLLGALARLDPGPADADRIVGAVEGWEIHPAAVAEARARLAAFLAARGWAPATARATAAAMVREGDFLADGPRSGAYAVLAGNPPYLRFAGLPAYFRSLYGGTVARHARGDLLHAFLDRCCDLLTEDGAIAFVSADRWLFNETAAALRHELGRRVGLSHVARLDARSAFYRPKSRRRGAPPRIHPVEILMRPAGVAPIPITRAPISPDDPAAAARPASRTLGDIATVRLAPWLGPAGIFVVDRTEARDLPPEALVPAVDTDDIDPETDELRPPRRVAVLTRRDAEPEGALRAHLLARQDRMVRRGRRPYWMPPETITLAVDRPALLVPRIARRIRVVPLPAGVLPINHNLSVVASGPGVGLEALHALLTSAASQDWIARHAPRLESGFLSISTTLLRRLPVPAAS